MSTVTAPAPISSVRHRSSSQPTPAVRLTRRGRVAVVVLALAVLGALAVVLGPSVVATDATGALPATTVVTVEPGQTLWHIAGEANPGGDPRDTVDDIMRMNSLSSPTLQPGADLAVPVYE